MSEDIHTRAHSSKAAAQGRRQLTTKGETEMSETIPTNPTTLSEAPASWNTRYLSPEGFVCQITLRAASGKELLEKVQGALNYLLEHCCAPYEVTYPKGRSSGYTSKGKTTGQASDAQPTDAEQACPFHHTPMQRWEKNGQVWFSHKLADGSWCSGKEAA